MHIHTLYISSISWLFYLCLCLAVCAWVRYNTTDRPHSAMSLLLFYRAYSFMCSHIVMNGSMAFARPTRTDMCVHITRAKGKAESTYSCIQVYWCCDKYFVLRNHVDITPFMDRLYHDFNNAIKLIDRLIWLKRDLPTSRLGLWPYEHHWFVIGQNDKDFMKNIF